MGEEEGTGVERLCGQDVFLFLLMISVCGPENVHVLICQLNANKLLHNGHVRHKANSQSHHTGLMCFM